jgi:hypothetical protein
MTDTYKIVPGGAINFALAFGAADTTKNVILEPSEVEKLYPYIYRGFVVIPNWTNVVTLTVAFTDAADGNSKNLDSDAGLAQNGTREITTLTVEVAEPITCTLTLSGAPGGAGGTIYCTFYSTENASGASSSLGPVVAISDIAKIAGVVPQMDSTDRLAVSVYGKNAASGDTEIHVAADGDVQVDVVSTTSDAILTTIDADTGSIATDASTIAGAIAGSEMQVDVVSTTSDAILTTIDSDTSALAGCVGGTELQIDVVSTTSDAILTTIDADTGSIATDASTIAGAIAGSEMQVDVVTTPTPHVTTVQAVIDMVGSGTNPSEIDSSAMEELHVYVKKEFRWCFAANQTAANTTIASDTTSGVLPPGYWPFVTKGATLKFYIRSNDTNALTDGITYWSGEE